MSRDYTRWFISENVSVTTLLVDKGYYVVDFMTVNHTGLYGR